MMKQSLSLYRSILKQMLSSSSSFRDVDGCSFVTLRQYITVPAAVFGAQTTGIDDTQPFSLIHPHHVPGLRDIWRNKNPSCQILGPGMILLKNYLNILGQTGIVNTCERWGRGPGGFYEPCNRYGHKLRRRITSFGRNWDPVTRYENRYRCDGSEPPEIPYELIHLTRNAIKLAQTYQDDLPSMDPDTCLVSFYSTLGRLGIHQDRDESAESLEKGLPVVSISVGLTAEFWYGDTRDESKLCKVLLESGDVLIFGGKSRLIFHGVKRIIKTTCPRAFLDAVQLRPGHLNVTLKQV